MQASSAQRCADTARDPGRPVPGLLRAGVERRDQFGHRMRRRHGIPIQIDQPPHFWGRWTGHDVDQAKRPNAMDSVASNQAATNRQRSGNRSIRQG